MKKNLLLRLCLILMVSFLIYACRTDHLPENETTYNNSSKFQLTSKRISLDEAKHKAQLLPELEKAKNEFKNIKTNAFGKTINYGNGVSIDTDDVMYIEKGANIHTYTFHIIRENAPADAPVENLVLSNLPDGTYRELFVSYDFTVQEKQGLKIGIPVDAKGRVTITELAQGTYNTGGLMGKANETCVFIEKTMWHPCSSGKHNGFNANECEFINNFENGTPPTSYVMITRQCTAQPVDYGLGDNGEGGGGGSSGGLGGGNEEPEIPTIPIILGGPKSNNTNAPCKNVKEKFAKEAYKNKVATIDKSYYYNQKEETGFKEDKNGNFVDLPPSGSDALTITYDEDTRGYTHVHLNDDATGKYTPDGFEIIKIKIRMFSPADVNVLMGMANLHKSPENFADLYGTMLSSEGTYVIKFTGTATDIKTGFGTEDWKTTYEEYFIKNKERGNEINFLLFMKNEMQVKGVSLYEVKSNGKVYEYKLNTAQTKAESFECGN